MLYSFTAFADVYERMIVIPREICREETKAFAHEWFVSNGRGSYASASITGVLTLSPSRVAGCRDGTRLPGCCRAGSYRSARQGG